MERFLIEELRKWKNSSSRKPLILEGARQVGKTWLLRHLGKSDFKNTAYINCDNNPQMQSLFTDFNVQRLLRGFSAISEQKITAGETLIVLDEIQEIPLALTSLKYFCEEAPQYHIAVAGSLLGLAIHSGTGFPVGKVDRLSLYPLSFNEFLKAMKKDILLEMIRSKNWEETNPLSNQLIELLRQYYFTGGFPSAVQEYIETQDIKAVRAIQKTIIKDYQNDISKHAPEREIPKISLVWSSIPSQLAKENKKFIYGAIKTGGRAKEFENAIQWLVNAGIVHKITRINKFEMPLKYYEDFESFKLFVNDLGLLGAMTDAPPSEILVGNNIFTNYKGSFTEQFVAQEYFTARQNQLFYYTNENSTNEIDFVTQSDKIYPIEVKAEVNLKSKSLSTVLKNNTSTYGLRFSMSPYKEQERMTNVPLYLAGEYLRNLPE